MLTVVNFSHPLTEAAISKLALLIGVTEDDLYIITQPVQVDLFQPLTEQVMELVRQAVVAADNNPYNIDLFIPPGLSWVAAYMTIAFPSAHMIVMASDPNTTPRQFMPVQVVTNKNLWRASRLRY